MFLKLDYSEINEALVIKDSEDLNKIPETLYSIPMTVTEAISLLEDMRAVSSEGERKFFVCSGYSISLNRGYFLNSMEAISISIEEIRGEMSRPVFVNQFKGYYGAGSLLDGLRSFKRKLSEYDTADNKL